MADAPRARRQLRATAQALVLAALILCTLSAPGAGGVASAATRSAEHRAEAVEPAVRTPVQFRRKVVRLTNRARARHDLPRLRAKPCLGYVAQRWARTMARRDELVHNDLDAVQRACHRQVGVGENIAMGYRSPRSVVRAWMHSDGHRANILNRSFDAIGVGARRSGGTWWWVQDFADLR